MNGFLKTITKFDGFFVSFSPSFGLGEQRVFYKSVWGGMATLIILTFVLVYSINQFILWGAGDLIYKVSSQQQSFSEGSYLEQVFIKKDPIQYVDIYFESEIDPFDKNKMIIIPLLYSYLEDRLQLIDYEYDGENTVYVELNNQYDNYFTILLVNCIGNEQYLSETQKCSSKEYSDEFFNQKGLLSIVTIYNEDYDYSTKTYNEVITYIDLPFDSILSSEIQVFTNYEYIEQQEGFLFQSTEEYLVNKGCSSQIYTYTKGYHQQLYEQVLGVKNVIGSVYLEQNNIIFYVRVQYPTISEVLANISSIIQTILLIRYMFYALNRNQLNSYIKSLILHNYYPEWNDIKKIKKNNINSCVLEDKKLNKTSIQNFGNEVNEMINLKLDFINLIYEIHQMQKILQLISPPDILLNIHSNQTKLQFQANQDSNDFHIKNTWSSFEDYQDAINQNHLDPFLFSYHWKTKKKNDQSVYKISLSDNEQVKKQYKPTSIQDNVAQMGEELRIQESRINIKNNDQIKQD